MKIKRLVSILLTVTFLSVASLNIPYTVNASGVTISAESTAIGTVLYASGAIDGDFQWYRAESYNGEFIPIEGQTNDSYTLTYDDFGSYIKFSSNGIMSSNFIAAGNLAYKKTNITTSGYDEETPLTNAFDGDENTNNVITISNVADTHYLCLDLEDVYEINQIKFLLANNRINDLSIELSTDETEWDCVYSLNETMGRERIATFEKTEARYVKICFKSTSTLSAKFKEIEIFSANLPKVDNVRISGDPIAGEELEALFDCENGATEEDSIVNWYAYSEADDGSFYEWVGEGKNYIVSMEDEEKYIRCHVTPKNSQGLDGDVVKSDFTQKVELPPPPNVYDIFISGDVILGETLEVFFETENGATVSDSVVEWYAYNSTDDLADKVLLGTGKTYTIGSLAKEKYIRCHITPKTAQCIEAEVVKSVFTQKVELPNVYDIFISGNAILGETLEVDFETENGATEEDSIVEWYAYNSTDDLADKVLLSNGKTYIIGSLAEEKYIRCHITPRNSQGNEGEIIKSSFTQMVQRPEIPQINSAYISGNALVGETVRVEFNYTGDLSLENTQYSWYCIESSTNFKQAIEGVVGTERTLVITEAMKGKYLKCYITPKNSNGEEGIKKYTEPFGKIIASTENICVATTVKVTGESAVVGSVLTGVYTYANSSGVPEGESKYYWYRSTDRTTFKRINGADSKTYTLTEADKGCYIRFGVAVCVQGNDVPGDIVLGTDYVAVENLAYRKNIHSESSSYNDKKGYFTVDGDPTTYMYTYGLKENQLPYFITVDLGKETDINEVLLLKGAGQTTSFGVKVSTNGSEWLEAYSINEKVISNTVYRFSKPYKCRYVRFEMNGPNSNLEIYECEVYYRPNTIKPVITLNGDNPIEIPVGTNYVEPGYIATDDEIDDLTEKVIVTGGIIDTSICGEHEIIYTVKDAYNNETVVKRLIKVLESVPQRGDIAFGMDVIASSQQLGNEKEKAVDGNPNTYWSPQNTETTSELVVDVKTLQWVDKLIINADFSNVIKYQLYGANSTENWTKLGEGTNENQLQFNPVKNRYFKIIVEKSGDLKVNDFELYLSDKGKAIVAANSIAFSEDLNSLTNDLALSNTGLYNSIIEWSTTDANTITKDGSITRSDSVDKQATLSAKVTVNGQSHTVTFDVTVLKNSGTSGGSGSGSSSGGAVKTPNIGNGNSVVISGDVPNSKSPEKKRFSDLENVAWAEDYIVKLADKGIISGVGNNKFEPDASVTREQFVKMIVLALDLYDENATTGFLDVKKSDWYYSFVASAIKNGIINGTSSDTFGTGSYVKRQDMCVMLERAILLKNPLWQNDAQSIEFGDSVEVADYAKNAVNKMKAANIINGMGDNLFAPNSYMTRAQAAKVLCLILEQVG